MVVCIKETSLYKKIILVVYRLVTLSKITYTFSNCKTLSSNLYFLRKIISLVNNIKFINYVYYHFRIILFYLYLLICFLLIFEEKK